MPVPVEAIPQHQLTARTRGKSENKRTHLHFSAFHDLQVVERVSMLELSTDDVAEDLKLRMAMGTKSFAGLDAIFIYDAESSKFLESLRRVIVCSEREVMVGLA
jgi:hypothetical protein